MATLYNPETLSVIYATEKGGRIENKSGREKVRKRVCKWAGGSKKLLRRCLSVRSGQSVWTGNGWTQPMMLARRGRLLA